MDTKDQGTWSPIVNCKFRRIITTVTNIGTQDISECSLWTYYQTVFLFIGIQWTHGLDPALEKKSYTGTHLFYLRPLVQEECSDGLQSCSGKPN